ncbi:hypothetical protein SAJA_12640 [Salinisphaera japonica YTM-1]|uniref:Uncharacterized protein n=1 Tax=Salinisphaera japonica YTM-1 TaxID=1209778 RepID=A0A423PJ84_9GAMM|nr:hypothetical protein SAJA_12640 [Salinisphaera japonica YTM-1]
MEAFDLVKSIGSGFGQRLLVASAHLFAFEHAEETSGYRVVSTVAYGAMLEIKL